MSDAPDDNLRVPGWVYAIVAAGGMAIAFAVGSTLHRPRPALVAPVASSRPAGSATTEAPDAAIDPGTPRVVEPAPTRQALLPSSIGSDELWQSKPPVPPKVHHRLGLSVADVTRHFGTRLTLTTKNETDGETFRSGDISLPGNVHCSLLIKGDPADLDDVLLSVPMFPDDERRGTASMLTVTQFMQNVVPGFTGEEDWWNEGLAAVGDADGSPQVIKAWPDRRLVVFANPLPRFVLVNIGLQALPRRSTDEKAAAP